MKNKFAPLPPFGGVLIILLGLLMMFRPLKSMNLIFALTGAAFLIKGIAALSSYFYLKKNFSSYGNSALGGILDLIFGFLLIFKRQLFSSLFSVALGAFALIKGIMNFFFTFHTRKLNSRSLNAREYTASFIQILVGIFCILFPTIGVTWIIAGVVITVLGISCVIFSNMLK